MCNCHDFLHSESSVGTFFLLTIAAVRRKSERWKNFPSEIIQRRKSVARIPCVPSRIKQKRLSNPKEQKLEYGLEESMAGSDPVSVIQPAMPIAEKLADNAEPGEDL
jgi:hypothetical protein